MFIVIYSDGDKNYFKNKKRTILHNVYGYSCLHIDGYKTYQINGKLYNPHGPAI